jgi:MarR family 2-MHQ and catechol resistance regulon transcriptional repressor
MKSTQRYGKKADLALSLWVKLARASSLFHRLTARDIATYNITQPQFAVLECLGHLGPMSIGMLCKKMLVSGGNMTVVVDNLERENLVVRLSEPEDRRQILVRLTPKGQKYFNEIFIKHAEYVTRLLSVLNETEQNDLSALLKKLGLALQEG